MSGRFDAMILLGVQLDANDEPTSEMIARADTAARAFLSGCAEKLVASGGVVEGHRRSEADVLAKLLMERGVPDAAILRENQSRDTMENMRFSARLLGGAKGKRVLVVTSDYHLLRSVWTARHVGFRAKGLAAPLPHDETWRTANTKEHLYRLDLVMGWQDEGKHRPEWTYRAFNRLFGIKK